MASKDLQIVLSVVTRGANEARDFATRIPGWFNKGRTAIDAFNKASGNGRRIMSSLESQIRGVITAAIGFKGITSATRIMEEASKAAYAMETSVAAANREFGNTGSVAEFPPHTRG